MADGVRVARTKLRSKETPSLPGRSRSRRRARLLAGNATRVLVLIAVVVGSGLLAGVALGYPVRSLDFGVTDAISLDQEALAGTIDAEQALVQLSDLPDSYVEVPIAPDQPVNLIGANYCGDTVEPTGQVGDRLTRAFADSNNHSFVLAEVLRVRQPRDAYAYINDMVQVFDGCEDQRYYTDDEPPVRVKILRDRSDVPLAADYVTRTIEPEQGPIKVVTYFEVGNVVVAIQYAGPRPTPAKLMDTAEREVLYRVASSQFTRTAKVDGEKPLPSDSTTTTAPDLVQPSPTSSPPAPTTAAPPPTFEPTTTSRSSRTTAPGR